MLGTVKPRMFVNGAVFEGLYGKCRVCGESLATDSSYRHEHRGAPGSIYNEDGTLRALAAVERTA
jgi:hypothetical protein